MPFKRAKPNPSFERTCAKSRAGRSIQTLSGRAKVTPGRLIASARASVSSNQRLPRGFIILTLLSATGGLIVLTVQSLPCTWNAYVERGPSLEELRRRLAEVPDHWREQVRRHVACNFRLRAQTHRDRPA